MESFKRLTKMVAGDVRKMKLDRSPSSISTDPEYIANFPAMKNLYRDAAFWHGTGRYKYGETGEVVDVLEGLLKEKRLLPHEDDWDKKLGTAHTVSVAASRIYARLYAGIYCPAATRISNELGSRELWGYYFFGTAFFRGMLEYIPSIRALRKGDDSSLMITDADKKIKKWVRKASVQEHDIKNIFLLGTDIAENYPILMGIRNDAVRPAPTSKFIKLHETRSTQPVLIHDLTHIEVPRNKVVEVKERLIKNGYDIPVLPIEFGEEYCRQFSFRTLTSGKSLVRKSE